MGIALRSFALFAAVATLAQAGDLYKSIDRDGRVIFSDAPVEGAMAVLRIGLSDSAKPVEAERLARTLALSDSADEAVAAANEKVDLAEHALALARSSLLEDNPLSLERPRIDRAGRQQLEFFKRDLLAARRNLMRALRQRETLAPARPFA
jgi:hypothetical protein